MTQVKICGIRRVEHALMAAHAGASMLGFVIAPSRRRVAPEEARVIMADVRRHHDVKAVGVFVNASADEMNAIARLVGLDYLQLSGEEDEATVRALERPSIKALHVGPDDTVDGLRRRACAVSSDMIMFDTALADSYGGTGATFDWSRVPALDRPFLLAGGLTPENIQDAIAEVRPWGVDVSSGVETDGEKDTEKIRLFLSRAIGAQ